LATHLTDDCAALRAATGFAQDMSQNCSRLSMFAAKQLIRRDLERTYAEGWDESLVVTKHLLLYPDPKEGVTSFVERRPPAFAPLPPDFELARSAEEGEGGAS
jgi:enoyl-CoA hydratase/carnithine racemase